MGQLRTSRQQKRGRIVAMVANNAGMPATPADLINVDEVIGKYYDVVPDPNVPEQRVSFGTSGHRGSSLKTSFNEAHIVAITAGHHRVPQASQRHRSARCIIGRGAPHALCEPAWQHRPGGARQPPASTRAHRFARRLHADPGRVPGAVLGAERRSGRHLALRSGDGLADGIVVTPSRTTRRRDGGFKYDPRHWRPGSGTDVDQLPSRTRANELLDSGDCKNIQARYRF